MLQIYKNITHQLTILFVLLSAFSINLPTRFLDLSLGLLFIFWVISGDFKNKIQRIKENPGALVALGFFVLIGLSIFYTSAPIDQALSGWLRYHGLLFIPIIVSTLDKKNDRNLAFNLFLISSVFVIIISYLKWIKIVPLDFGQDASISNFVVFKFRIAHSVFMAFASFIFLSKFLESKKIVRYLWLVIAIAIIFNIIFLVDSRTGQIAILAALVFFGVTYKNTKILKYILFLLEEI
jgi:O-antigen ligase